MLSTLLVLLAPSLALSLINTKAYVSVPRPTAGTGCLRQPIPRGGFHDVRVQRSTLRMSEGEVVEAEVVAEAAPPPAAPPSEAVVAKPVVDAPATPAPAASADPAAVAMPDLATLRNGELPQELWATDAGFQRSAGMEEAWWSMMLKGSQGYNALIVDQKLQFTLPVAEEKVSIDVPLFPRPSILDGTHAGDIGFDPVNLATNKPTLEGYMESEIKHGRLAMLAVFGWPLAELWGNAGLASNGRAPSLLNGELLTNPVNLVSVLAVFGAFGFLEKVREDFTKQRRSKQVGPGPLEKLHIADGPYVPGCWDFDPAGLYSVNGDDAAGRRSLRTAEVWNGRAAMVAISLFAFVEAATKGPITGGITSVFFKPFWQVIIDSFLSFMQLLGFK